ncbi:hypothetical protein D3C78_923100 [compost metagenome]
MRLAILAPRAGHLGIVEILQVILRHTGSYANRLDLAQSRQRRKDIDGLLHVGIIRGTTGRCFVTVVRRGITVGQEVGQVFEFQACPATRLGIEPLGRLDEGILVVGRPIGRQGRDLVDQRLQVCRVEIFDLQHIAGRPGETDQRHVDHAIVAGQLIGQHFQCIDRQCHPILT